MPSNCVICASPILGSTLEWLWRCPACGLESSTLADARHNPPPLQGWDAESERFMRALRVGNADRLLKRLARARPLADARVLDIGCAAGWFLKAARSAGMHATGIEPDADIAHVAQSQGLEVLVGYFPECLPTDARYDVICLHDVFEHMPDPRAVLAAMRSALAPDGLLLLNLPNADGILHKIARAAQKLGDARLLERLWQKGYASPHLYYYNPRNLTRLLQSEGFACLATGRLPSVAFDGLWARVREGDRFHPLLSAMVFAGIAGAYPLLQYVLPPDIMYQIYSPASGD